MKTIVPAPHLHSENTTLRIMGLVILALIPALAGGVYFFGIYSLKIAAVSIAVAQLSEIASKGIFRKRLAPFDGSAVLTGLLTALILPPTVPLWMAGLGSFLAILLVKELFGGLGFNIFNPALTARAVLLISFPAQMTRFALPRASGIDAFTSATPLTIAKEGLDTGLPSLWEMFWGSTSGSMGETSAMLLLAGGLFLLAAGIITCHIPFAYIITVALLALVTGESPLFHLLSGGLVIGAFFMATDYVTSPITPRGKIWFGFGCGLITFLIRRYGGYPEGVTYAIIFMNMLVPLIEKYSMPRVFGARV